MAATPLSPAELEQLTELARQWGKIIANRVTQQHDPLSLNFRALEQIAQAAASGLIQGTVQNLAQQQAGALEVRQPCPQCGGLCTLTRQTRTIQVEGGTILDLEEPLAHCPDCRRDFFPLRTFLGLDSHNYSPALMEKIVTAGGHFSFGLAAKALKLAHLTISPKHVRELTRQVGQELMERRDGEVIARRQRALQPEVAMTPGAVVVEPDGGRLRTRLSGAGLGVHQQQSKEDKVAAFVTLHSQDFDNDPCPQPPPSFLDCRRVRRLVRQMQGQAADPAQRQNSSDVTASEAEAAADLEAAEAVPSEEVPERPRWSPRKKMLTCVASMAESREFGPMMAAEAQKRDFFAARKRAFVADGAAYNWSIQRGYFPDFEPIVDLLHVACYLYSAAVAVGAVVSGVDGWGLYVRWFTLCWQGQVSQVVAALSAEQVRVGVVGEDEEASSSDPRLSVGEALVYLSNNACRMDYPRYRQSGLPTTSSLVESLVGEVNARVKDRRKFWDRVDGAELILQARAAVLSEDGRLEDFFANRPGYPFRRRSTAVPAQQTTTQAA